LSLLLAACNPGEDETVAKICLESCDDIIEHLAQASGSIDEAMTAAHAANSLDEAGQLFVKSSDELVDLRSIVQADIAVTGLDAFQQTDEILRSSSQYSDALQRLGAWSQENEEGKEFFGNLVCAYRDAAYRSWSDYQRDPTLAELFTQFAGRYSKAPADADSLQEPVIRLWNGLNQQNINIWDNSITLYCILSGLSPN
jgi:hypothetical protein